METYRGWSGLTDLASQLTGDESIHVGIRPFGLHAGNVLSIVAYPYLLCEALADRGTTPRFQVYLSINDWEQDAPHGPDPVRYPYNIVPKLRTLQFAEDAVGPVCDQWAPRIVSAYSLLLRDYPHVHLAPIRNSSLRDRPVFRELIRTTLQRGRQIGMILKRFGRFPVLLDPEPIYASAVCPKCLSARGNTIFGEDLEVTFNCTVCGSASRAHYEGFQYWWHHKPMFVGRWYELGFDIAISGGDHFDDNDALLRDEIRKVLGMPPRSLKMLFAPTLTDSSGTKISKSAHNEVQLAAESLIAHARAQDGRRIEASHVPDRQSPKVS
jgi:lysyl-tRNA synthetase class I